MKGRDLALGVAVGAGLSALAGAWLAPAARAQGTAAAGEAAGTIACTAAGPGGVPLLFLVDTREKAFAVYRVDPTKGGIKLEASRPYRHDLKLEYNNLEPLPAAVEAIIGPSARR